MVSEHSPGVSLESATDRLQKAVARMVANQKVLDAKLEEFRSKLGKFVSLPPSDGGTSSPAGGIVAAGRDCRAESSQQATPAAELFSHDPQGAVGNRQPCQFPPDSQTFTPKKETTARGVRRPELQLEGSASGVRLKIQQEKMRDNHKVWVEGVSKWSTPPEPPDDKGKSPEQATITETASVTHQGGQDFVSVIRENRDLKELETLEPEKGFGEFNEEEEEKEEGETWPEEGTTREGFLILRQGIVKGYREELETLAALLKDVTERGLEGKSIGFKADIRAEERMTRSVMLARLINLAQRVLIQPTRSNPPTQFNKAISLSSYQQSSRPRPTPLFYNRAAILAGYTLSSAQPYIPLLKQEHAQPYGNSNLRVNTLITPTKERFFDFEHQQQKLKSLCCWCDEKDHQGHWCKIRELHDLLMYDDRQVEEDKKLNMEAPLEFEGTKPGYLNFGKKSGDTTESSCGDYIIVHNEDYEICLATEGGGSFIYGGGTQHFIAHAQVQQLHQWPFDRGKMKRTLGNISP